MHNTFLTTTMNFCLSLTNNYQALLQSKHPMNSLKREQQLNAVVLSEINIIHCQMNAMLAEATSLWLFQPKK